MASERAASSAVELVFDALADADCRRILSVLEEPRTASEVADLCDMPQTSTYRKLETLSEAALVAEQTAVRRDGHHATTYVRDFDGVFVAYDDGEFVVDVVDATADGGPADGESPDERLARLWSQIREGL